MSIASRHILDIRPLMLCIAVMVLLANGFRVSYNSMHMCSTMCTTGTGTWENIESIQLEGVANLRPALPGSGLPLYRSAALDGATAADVERLLDAEGLNIRTIIDLRNTDEIMKGYSRRQLNGGISFYSKYRVALNAIDCLRVTSKKQYYADASRVLDLYYLKPPLVAAPTTTTVRGTGAAESMNARRVFEIPLFGDVEEFFMQLKDMTVRGNTEQLVSGWQWLFDPKALTRKLIDTLAEGGLPLLYAVMLEVSSKRIAAALGLCLAVSEDYADDLMRLSSSLTASASSPTSSSASGVINEAKKKNTSNINNSMNSNKGSVDYSRSESVPVSASGRGPGAGGGAGAAGTAGAGGLLFHCAQGKDRTGILGMLLTFALYGDTEEAERRAVFGYSVSEELLLAAAGGVDEKNSSSSSSSSSRNSKVSELLQSDGGDGMGPTAVAAVAAASLKKTSTAGSSSTSNDKEVKKEDKDREPVKTVRNPGNLADVESMRGSPATAMIETIRSLRDNHGGSVLGYLDYIGFSAEYRKRLQRAADIIAKSTVKLRRGGKQAGSNPR